MSSSGARGLEEKELLQKYEQELQMLSHALTRTNLQDEDKIVNEIHGEIEKVLSSDQPIKDKDAKLAGHQERLQAIEAVVDKKLAEARASAVAKSVFSLNAASIKLGPTKDALDKLRKHYAPSLVKQSEVKISGESKELQKGESKSLGAEQEAILLTQCRNKLAGVSHAFETIVNAKVEKGEEEADSLKKGIDDLLTDFKDSAKNKFLKISDYLTRLEKVKNQTQQKYDVIKGDRKWHDNPIRPLESGEVLSEDQLVLKVDREALDAALTHLDAILPIMKKLQSNYADLYGEEVHREGKICGACSDVISNAFCDHIAKLHNKEYSKYCIQDGKEEHMVSYTLFLFNQELAKDASKTAESLRYECMEGLARSRLLKLLKTDEKVDELINGPLENTMGMSKEAQFFVAMLNAKRDSVKLQTNLDCVFSGKLDLASKAKTEKGLASRAGKFFHKHLPAKVMKVGGEAKKFLSEKNPIKKVAPLAQRRSRPVLRVGS